ncbi:MULTISPECIES: hypothetical protein [unclassified Chamaesiphon]|uniref:hypothetical protein n=1 Tax=unclassified Chamaesiphon TaxID=2620921 RepID=UPI00286AF060|nr:MULTISPECIES: hypothetical protein [unclassified Chamaesiphon]
MLALFLDLIIKDILDNPQHLEAYTQEMADDEDRLLDGVEIEIDRLERLEDLAIGKQAQSALSTSRMVGTEIFTAEIQRLAAMDADC